MSGIAWPVGLPQRMNASGFTETLPDLALRTEMDAGPRKARRRFTTGPSAIEGAVTLRAGQPALLEAFYRDTTAGGTLPFDWTHPRTGTLKTFRFTAPPAFVPVAGDVWRATLKLEVLP
ncbi:MAG: hypothetical protein IT204_17670 [Fimbriimonadaceae bacterium]|nr:hypothetical protein [Fimbriimonadaceae bacterium]